MDTTNTTTVRKAVQLRERIQKEFTELLALIKSSRDYEAIQKLGFLYRAIDVFVDDEKDSLLKSDRIALEILQEQVLKFKKDYEENTLAKRLAIAQSLQRMAENVLKTS